MKPIMVLKTASRTFLAEDEKNHEQGLITEMGTIKKMVAKAFIRYGLSCPEMLNLCYRLVSTALKNKYGKDFTGL